ncbi:hypothetical protein [Mycobacterium sp. PS03-16]|uniref:hypothetical protein n=1 Tax=Mycobacterium sp. PS03-16 TaxID=2559611 RepID=UPI0014309BCA|nr:hypothetical protein [Mycobacterium sp. PS03-16]
MARSDADTCDRASSVGVTATMVAHYGHPFPTGDTAEALRASLAVTADKRWEN